MDDIRIVGALAALCAGLFAYASWRADQPPNPNKPRLLPWRTIIVVSGAVGALFIIHLVRLAAETLGQGPG
ncbi:MAG: hypothetical protein AB7O04_16140 [Hyphomonadaceae bacterium]